ncbi:IclR family transcriptional regulator [Trebonia sp.]|uniref:IclR family transcriptional regulator n=1 Tax=Trebonia sp. TaxID=2767075 RepID=UPI002602C647|nr:IclR family transcriptional regulator [Trebonia sp.]
MAAGHQMHARTTTASPSAPTGTQAVDRAARLVSEVVAAPDSVTFTELAAATGLAKSTTSRLLLALERNGLVRRDDDGRFSPGEMFVRYAWRGGAEAGLVEVARPFLDRLGSVTGETVNLGVARDGVVEQIAQVDAKYLIGGTNWVGRPVPLHCAALGKVLLAYGAASLPPGRLAARTSRTITSRGALLDDLRFVRDRGYAVTDEELEPGLVAVAAPVRRDGGVVVAAMSVSAPSSRLSAAKVSSVAEACVAAAGGLSAALGYRAASPRLGPTSPIGPAR